MTSFPNNETPLHRAARHGDVEQVRSLIDQGASIDAVEGDGWTALHFAVQEKHAPVVLLLLERGARIDVSEKRGWTALHLAAYWGYRDLTRVLLEHAANVGATTSRGSTPLHLAASKGHADVVDVLAEGALQQARETQNRLQVELDSVTRSLASEKESGQRAKTECERMQIAAEQAATDRKLLEKKLEEAVEAQERTALALRKAEGRLQQAKETQSELQGELDSVTQLLVSETESRRRAEKEREQAQQAVERAATGRELLEKELKETKEELRQAKERENTVQGGPLATTESRAETREECQATNALRPEAEGERNAPLRASAGAPEASAQAPTKTAKEWLDSGIENYFSGRYDAAIADCTKAIELDPSSAEACYYHRGQAKEAKHDMDGAKVDYGRGCGHDCSRALARLTQATMGHLPRVQLTGCLESPDEWLEESFLKHVGYSVGANAPGDLERRACIMTALEHDLPTDVFTAAYIDEYGRTGSPVRIWKIAESIAAFCRLRVRKLRSQRQSVDQDDSVCMWEKDLDWMVHQFPDVLRPPPSTRPSVGW